MIPPGASLDSIFRITKQIGRISHKKPKSRRDFFKLDNDTQLYLILVIAPPAFTIVLALSGYFSNNSALQAFALLCMALTYISAPIIYPLVMLFRYRKTVLESLTLPVGILIGNVRRGVRADCRYVLLLARKNPSALGYALAYIRLERAAFEKRIGLLTGALDKIGIIPGLITLALAFNRLGWLGPRAIASPWLEGGLYGVFGLYLLGFIAHLLMAKLDRMICALELAIASQAKA